jgi:hypothetical protein
MSSAGDVGSAPAFAQSPERSRYRFGGEDGLEKAREKEILMKRLEK